MRPTRLEMRNFLAYRAPDPIVFAGIDLACLTGRNGVGKSSIFDAITWALWGKARAKRDEDLIHLGQSDMSVSVDFEQDGLRYRARRRRSRTGRGARGALDLMVWGGHDQPRLINEDGMRKTQDKINAILRIDYETFVHSAYLQQGRADAFTLKGAADRKRILADILGLERWAAYEEAAKARWNKIAAQIDILEHDIRRIETEIGREPMAREELADISAALSATNARLEKAEERYSSLANIGAVLGREKRNQLELERRMAARRDDSAAAANEIKRLDTRIADYDRTIARDEAIEGGYQQLQDARQNQSALAEQLARIRELETRRHDLEGALREQAAALMREADVARERVSGLEQLRAAADETDYEALQRQARELRTLEARRGDIVKADERDAAKSAELRTRLENLTETGSALSDRLGRLEAAEGAICPLCGQALTLEHRAEMVAELGRQRDAMRGDYVDVRAELKAIGQRRRGTEAKLDELALRLKDLPALQARLGAAAETRRKAEEAQDQLEIEEANLAGLEARLEGEDYGRELRRQLAELGRQRDRVGYDPDSHADIRAQLERFAAFDRQHSQLEFARMNRPEAVRARIDAAERLAKLEATLQADEAERERIAGEIAELHGKVAQERERRAEVDAIRAEAQTLNERRAIAAQELQAIAAGRDARQRLNARLDSARHERGLYHELRGALGKNGAPAMIIETAIPELEAEANDLLARMSDGRMKLGIHTQRQRASGNLAETLDIEISDELGTRPYDLYSGGESFRINFAIRIALSRLLARRAGAQLRALFIDEGFGTQDDDGQGKLVEAISKIAADFDLVLVITHIDDLREAFPAHLVVEKTAEGSIVRVQ